MSNTDELRELFKKNAGEDGLLTRREMGRIIKNRMESGCVKMCRKPEDIKRRFDEWDKDGDAKLNFEEFQKAVEEMLAFQ